MICLSCSAQVEGQPEKCPTCSGPTRPPICPNCGAVIIEGACAAKCRDEVKAKPPEE